MQLRPYQTSAIHAVRDDWAQGFTDTLLVAATGAGKTQMFLRLLLDALEDRTKRGLILAHRAELIDQPLERIRHIDPDWLRNTTDQPRVGVVMADRNDCDRQLTIATVQTLSSERRINRLLAYGPIDYLVIDECHHATAKSYLAIVERLRTINPHLRHLGVTATPLRADGDGLARVYQKASAKITIADLVKAGYLVQPRWLGISTGISIAGVQTRQGDFVQGQLANQFDTPSGRTIILTAYQKYAHDRRAIAFTASVQGAHDLADTFNGAGIIAAAIDGGTPKETRRHILNEFRAGRIQVLTNCQVLTEGFDAPGTSCILMCRPTRSDALYIQCMGRGLRPLMGMAQPGEDCLVLDFLPVETRNIVMAGDVLGIPKDKADAIREIIEHEDDEEIGEVQAGFTFDGNDIDTHGTPLEIITRELRYLDQSPYVWCRRDGILSLGLGENNGTERILAIVNQVLWGLWRNGRYERWNARPIPCDDSFQKGQELADKWGAAQLTSKGRMWRQNSASDGQRRYLRRLARGSMSLQQIELLTSGQAAELITHYQVVQTLATRGEQ